MNRTAAYFMKAAVLYALSGIALGAVMAASHNFGMSSAHAHLSLLGWVTMALYALYYQLVPHAAETSAAKVHFWLANFGVLMLAASVALIARGFVGAEAGAAVGSIALLVSMLVFACIVFTVKEGGQPRRQAAFSNNDVFISLDGNSKHI